MEKLFRHLADDVADYTTVQVQVQVTHLVPRDNVSFLLIPLS